MFIIYNEEQLRMAARLGKTYIMLYDSMKERDHDRACGFLLEARRIHTACKAYQEALKKDATCIINMA